MSPTVSTNASDQIARVSIRLLGVSNPVVRCVEVPLLTSLLRLHDIIQAVMLFVRQRDFEFAIGSRCYGRNSAAGPNDRSYYGAGSQRLAELHARGVLAFSYVYDFDAYWHFVVEIESVGPADPDCSYPRLVESSGTAPPEQCGGVAAFNKMMSKKPAECSEMTGAPSRRSVDISVSEKAVNARLAKIAHRSRLGRANHEKTKPYLIRRAPPSQ